MRGLNDYANQVVLVDDETQTLLSFSIMLKSSGLKDVVTIGDSREVIPFLEKHGDSVALMVLDLAMPFISGQELLPQIKQTFPEVPVIVMTATNEIDTAVECMKAGAVDYLVKPVEKNRFLSSIQQAMEIRRLKYEVSHLRKYILSDKLENPAAFSRVVTGNKQMFSIFKYVEAISRSPQPVLITGETGVGKELIARAANGTVFLDEIGDLNEQSQVKLLRLIQEKEYYALGSDIARETDAHIVVATNQDLQPAMEKGTFRRDLYFRLCFHHIHVPPLRERPDDIPLLLHYFLQKAAESLDKTLPTPAPQLINLLSAYDFPGNIRELESMVYDAVSRHRSGILSMETFKKAIETSAAGEPTAPPRQIPVSFDRSQTLETIFGNFPTLKQVEDYLIDQALKRADGNQGVAASFLGITRQALNKRLHRRKE